MIVLKKVSMERDVVLNTLTLLIWNSSMPCLPPSRPNPDSFTPPNGATGSDTMPELIPVIPTNHSQLQTVDGIRRISCLEVPPLLATPLGDFLCKCMLLVLPRRHLPGQ